MQVPLMLATDSGRLTGNSEIISTALTGHMDSFSLTALACWPWPTIANAAPDPDAHAKISHRMAIAPLAGSVDCSPEFRHTENSPKESSPSEPGTSSCAHCPYQGQDPRCGVDGINGDVVRAGICHISELTRGIHGNGGGACSCGDRSC